MASQPATQGTEQYRYLLRQKYRKAEEKARNNAEVLATITSGALAQTLSEVNELQEYVTKPREHALDAGLFYQLTEVGARATEKLVNHQHGRTVHDFITAIKCNYVNTANPQEDGCEDPSAFDWHRLSENVARFFKLAPGASCMLGPMDVQSKARRVVQRQAKRPTGEVVRPEELDEIVEQEKQETDRNMEEMWKVLKQEPCCPVSDMICNHSCFAQTVENLFTLSFLVRDQRAYLYNEAEQGLMVRLVDAKSRPAPQPAGDRKVEEQLQFVMAITMADWEVMKKVVKPDKTKMRHRDQSAVMAMNIGARRQQQQQQQQQQGEEAGPSRPGPSPAKKRRSHE